MATPNLLIHEKSPYLLQHAHNPVGWHPWGERAFERARTEDKPIFLSIGYSTCHWCHVMERESFENEAIAGLLNDHFIPIKVDREERPDVDRIYMVAVQAMGVGGGWPLSMFLTPDLQPFYGGTYFPPVSRYGRAGFPDILKRIHDAWINERSKIHESAQAITAYLREAPQAGAGEPGAGVLKACYDQFLGTYDTVYGGFGDGPKFPRPSVFQFLLRYHRHTGDPHALEMTRHSLRLMASGGMYDHVGGGFHRYSVDGEWRVPHFEKMLYDQAQLVIANLETFQVTRDPLYSAVVQDTIGYVLRDMRVPGGAFCSAEDADSLKPWAPEESGEGAFYLWTQKEIMEMLGQEAGEIFCFAYGVMEEGNAPSDPQQEFVGQNILFIAHGSESTCARFHLTREQLVAVLAEARSKLLARRAGRPRPLRDDKVITAWNGLMISACARAGAALGEPDFITAARFAATFILDTLYDRTKEILLRRFREGEVAIPGQLDDYAFMIQALLDLYEAAGDAGILAHAVRLMKLQLERFEDVQEGGFFDTAEGGTDLLVRTKERYDGAEPSGNSVSALNLLRLSALIDRPLWRDAASRTIAAAGKLLNTQPSALPLMAAGLEFLREPGDQIFIVGDAGDPGIRAFLREIHSRFLPHRVLHMFRPGTEQTQIAQLIPFAGSLKMSENKPTAYLCRDFVCHLPTTDPAELGRALDSARPSSQS